MCFCCGFRTAFAVSLFVRLCTVYVQCQSLVCLYLCFFFAPLFLSLLFFAISVFFATSMRCAVVLIVLFNNIKYWNLSEVSKGVTSEYVTMAWNDENAMQNPFDANEWKTNEKKFYLFNKKSFAAKWNIFSSPINFGSICCQWNERRRKKKHTDKRKKKQWINCV